MTDNDTEIIQQLQNNVDYNLPILRSHFKSSCAKRNGTDDDDKCHEQTQDEKEDADLSILVESLDWNDDVDNLIGNIDIDLVIGSELVYSDITANALLKLLKRLLSQNPNIQIWIVQVIDRYGWLDIVLPGLLTMEEESCDKNDDDDDGGNTESSNAITTTKRSNKIKVTSIPIPIEIIRHNYTHPKIRFHHLQPFQRRR